MPLQVPLLKFDEQGDIHLAESNDYCHKTTNQKDAGENHYRLHRCVLFRYTIHQMSLILFVIIYVIVGGLFFAFIESRNVPIKDNERSELFTETYGRIRRLSEQLLNDQLNDNFEDVYYAWRWQKNQSFYYIHLDSERQKLLDNSTGAELEVLSARLAMRQATTDKYVYKWTYSTAILYAATLVTTIGYGNIAPKTAPGKMCTVVYALVGILLVVIWLKQVGDMLAFLVTHYYFGLQRFIKRHIIGQRRRTHRRFLQANVFKTHRKVPVWVPVNLLLLYLIGGSLLFAVWEGWSYVDGAYFSFITFTTIGFGDLVPGENTLTQQSGRSVLCALYLLFGLLLTAMSFKLIQNDFDRLKIRLLRRLGIDHTYLLYR